MSLQRARVAARAYDLWERRGKPEGSPEADWYAAEKDLLADANDPSQPKATLDSLQRQAAEVLLSDLDKGPIASDTETVALDTPVQKRARTGRTTARRTRGNGATAE